MSRTKPDILFHEHFKPLQRSVVLLHGVFDPSFFDLFKKRKKESFYVLEGRPTLEGGKTCCRELLKRGITPTVITDNMAGFLFSKDMVREVWLAYVQADDRGAMCAIGSSILGLLAKYHNVPVHCYPAVRKRKPAALGTDKDLLTYNGTRVAPRGIKTYVPLMEWVPGKCFEESYEPRKDQ